MSIAHWIGNSHQLGLKFGYVVKVTHYQVTKVREETMFLTEPIIKEAWNESVAHVRPYIGEVVEAFSPQLRVPLPMVETVRERWLRPSTGGTTGRGANCSPTPWRHQYGRYAPKYDGQGSPGK